MKKANVIRANLVIALIIVLGLLGYCFRNKIYLYLMFVVAFIHAVFYLNKKE
ncbi:MAG: hypothetical protein ACI3W7_06355 [Oscillospiraceae bacterium]